MPDFWLIVGEVQREITDAGLPVKKKFQSEVILFLRNKKYVKLFIFIIYVIFLKMEIKTMSQDF